ncbi:hypothetical protein JYT44_03170 [Caldithrix abyssi]|nr:hypothetical protein [Caldithrix abyssi]
MSKPLSRRLGELFAHIQDLMDTVTHTAINRIQEKGGKKNRLLGFFSSFGDAYFRKYTDIKKKKENGSSLNESE